MHAGGPQHAAWVPLVEKGLSSFGDCFPWARALLIACTLLHEFFPGFLLAQALYPAFFSNRLAPAVSFGLLVAGVVSVGVFSHV